MTFLNPLDALIPKIPFSFFSRFLGQGHLQAPGVRLGRILGGLSIEPFLGEGGVRPEGSIDPPPRKQKPGLPRGDVAILISPHPEGCPVGFAAAPCYQTGDRQSWGSIPASACAVCMQCNNFPIDNGGRLPSAAEGCAR